MSRYNPHVDNKPILDFADVWRRRSLLDGKSLFTDMHLDPAQDFRTRL